MVSPLNRLGALVFLAAMHARPAAAGICVSVDLRFAGREPSPQLVHALQSEATSIWNRYGVRFRWPDRAGEDSCNEEQASFDILVDDRTPPGIGARRASVRSRGVLLHAVLASTRMASSTIEHHAIFLDRGATERLLQSVPADQLIRQTGEPTIAPADVGRALGRTLAHELGHVLLGVPGHQRSGLMRAKFLTADLVGLGSRTYRLSEGEVERLRRREQELTRRTQCDARRPD
jgi:hypothetical protein